MTVKRMLLSVVCLVVGAILAGFVLEHTWLAHERAAVDWRWPSVEADASTPDDDLGLTWVVNDRWMPPSTRRDDLAWLRRKLAQVGILATVPGFASPASPSFEERVAAMKPTRSSLLVFHLDARDIAIAGTKPEERATPSTSFAAILGRIPALRLLVEGSPSFPRTLPSSRGAFLATLWPWRRDGAPDETKRYASLRAALERLAALGEENQLHTVCVYTPTAFEVDDAFASDMIGALGLDSAVFETRRLDRRVRDLCDELSLPLVSARDLLRRMHAKTPVFEGQGARTRWTERARRALFGPVASRLKKLIDDRARSK